MTGGRNRVAPIVLAVVLSSPLLGIGAGPGSAAAVVLFAEDFDGDWPPNFYALYPVPGSWRVVDNNAASGFDYWGRTSARAFGGTYSAWCAQNGVNSVNYELNSVNGYYDQDMQSCMMVYLGDIQGYDLVALGFRYWAETGTTFANDYLEVRVYDGNSWTRIWMQPDVGSMAWESVGVEIPNTAIWLGFFFISDAELGGGPYEGVYVDNIVIGGDDVDNPTSRAGPLAEYWIGEMVYIPYSANDSFGSGVEYVELYYRSAGTDVFTRYVTPDNVDGRWLSTPIPFNVSLVGGDARYEFYTIATDVAGNVEPAPGTPDAYVAVDNSPPNTEAVISDSGIYSWYSSSVDVMLWASDSLSGVSGTWYRLGDDDAWQSYEAGVTVTSEGLNEIQYYSEDQAGNTEQVRFAFIAIDTEAPELFVTGPADGLETELDEVMVSWNCSDDTSGTHYVTVTVDGAWSEYCNSTTEEVLLSGLGVGEHVISLVGFDRAGNSVQATLNVTVLGELEKVNGGGPSLVLAVAIVIGLVVLGAIVYAVGRRRSRPGGGQNAVRSGEEVVESEPDD